MRNVFIKTLTQLAPKHPEIFLIVGDLGYGVIEEFAQKFPRQFLNAGIAEQNMTGMAAGLALSGKTIFTYSIANFPILRPLEQVRNDICYHNANVKIVSVGGGFFYHSLGSTHHGTEDISIMRTLPNMTVLAPGDAYEAECATRALIEHSGPCFLRLTKAPESTVHTKKPAFKIGKAIQIGNGSDVALITTGGMLEETIKTAEFLKRQKISARVISMHTVKPLDAAIIKKTAREVKMIATIEDHQTTGGLGSAVAEVLAEISPSAILFKRFGIPDIFIKHIGSVEYIKEKLGLTAEKLSKKIQTFLAHDI